MAFRLAAPAALALLWGTLVLLALAQPVAEEGAAEWASELLEDDDACLDDTDGQCGVSLRQLRAQKRTLEADERVQDEREERGNQSTRGPTRLRITNGCTRQPMWVAHMAGAGLAPGTAQNVQVPPGASHDFNIPDGLASTRYWPKFGCNPDGSHCHVGESGGPGQTCDRSHGCAPPVDSKFEATFGVVGQRCDTAKGLIKGCDWLDISMVDGYTVPFKVDVVGNCGGHPGVDCSDLTPGVCPRHDNLGGAGVQDLRVFRPGSYEVVGCYSPCAKLTYSNWGNELGKHSPADPAAQWYCCPTPPIQPAQCSSGPVIRTNYVETVHRTCPGVYAYAYDDATGLSVCPAGVHYHVTFYCPN